MPSPRLPRVLAGVCTLALALLVPVPAVALAAGTGQVIVSDSFRYDIAPAPAFVQRHADVRTVQSGQNSETNTEILLVDRQVSLLQAEPQEYIRSVVRALNSQGLTQVAQVYIEFNPDYQRLTLHALRIIRGSQVLDHTRDVRLDLLRREQGLEQNVYGGEVTALGILPDVRVGDLVEMEYSIAGDNPIFAGRYAQRFPLQSQVPTLEKRIRLVHPEGRNLRLKWPALVTLEKMSQDGIVTETVTVRDRKALSDDPDRPAWYDPMPWLEVSEYADWGEVRRWAGGLFQVHGQLAPELAARVAAWKTSGLPPARLATEILRWVQGDIRYFGIELGINSHQPAHPNQTVQRRYGDCKDKSLLLATLLNAVGIEASPALVSHRLHRSVADKLPGHATFDHAIVRARIDGHDYWLDATLPPQPGPIDAIGVIDHGRALVLADTGTGLADASFPPGYRNEVLAVDRYRVAAWNGPVELQSETILTGIRAERLRWLLSTQGREEFERQLRASTQRILPNAVPVGELSIGDDRETNRLTLIERYNLPELFRYETGKFTAEALAVAPLEHLKLPQVPQRATPFGLAHPARVRHTILFELPDNPIRHVPASSVERTPYWEMRTSYRSEPSRLEIEYVLDSRAEAVPPEATQAYIEDTVKLRRLTSTQFSLRVAAMPDEVRADLMQTLRRYDHFGDTRSGALAAEIKAHASIAQISLDLASGKLNDGQRAQALAARGIAYDETDRPVHALSDLDEAIRLVPDKLRYRLDKAAVLAGRARFAEAVALFADLAKEDKLREATASDLMHYGRSLYYLGRSGEAVVQMEAANRLGEQEGNLFSAIWLHLASHNQDRPTALEGALARNASREWPYPIGEMLLNRRTPESLLEAAHSSDSGLERDQLCEAYFYLGQKYLLDGDREQAREFFDKAYRQDVKPYSEYVLARHELERLGGPPKRGLLNWFGRN